MKRKIVLLLSVLLGIMLSFSINSYAAENMIPTASNNIQNGLIRKSALVSVDSGYMRVFYDKNNKNIGVEYYDNNFKILSKKKIKMELSIYGGFYAGTDAYYIVVGQNNTEEKNDAEIIRVIKYDKNWKRLGAAKITSDPKDEFRQVRFPFDYGCVEMTEVGNKLYIVTGHEGYVDELYNQGHQGKLMIEVDKKALTGKIIIGDLWHSFAQYIDYKDPNLYLLELSEGSRYAKITRYDKNTFKANTIPILRYGGERTSAWSIPCYASVDGMAISSNNILTVGTSIDQSKYDTVTKDTAHNIYVTVTPMNKFTEKDTKVIWITNHKDNGKSFVGLEIVKINDNRFMISWEEFESTQNMKDNDILSTSILHYIFVDSNGNKIGSEYTAAATISDCKPILKGDKLVYYASNDNMVNFYTININDGKFNKVMYRVAGENATWNLDKNGVLTISGTGAMFIDTNAKFRSPLSSTSGHSYSSLDNAWKPIRDLVKEINVKEGITSIPDNQFRYFSNLTQVVLPKSMTLIGKNAFERCMKLDRVVVLENVKTIGEDAFWSGYYTDSSFTNKITYTVLYLKKGTEAEKWAKANKVQYKYVDDLALTDFKTKTIVKALGESGVKLKVNALAKDNKDYTDMKAKLTNKSVLSAYTIGLNDGLTFGDNVIIFTVGDNYKDKNITILQKKSDGTIKSLDKKVDNKGQISISTNELSSFMLGIDPKDIQFILGDINKNNKVEANDAFKVLELSVSGKKPTSEELNLGDINKNGRIDANDAYLILAYSVGMKDIIEKYWK